MLNLKLHKGFLPTTEYSPKAPTIPNWNKDSNLWKSYKEVQKEKGFGGIIADDIVCLDTDTEKANELIKKIIKVLKLKTIGIKTNKGFHFYFKIPKNSQLTTSANIAFYSATGIKFDYLYGGHFDCLKDYGREEERPVVYGKNTEEIEELPYYFYPVSCNEKFSNLDGLKKGNRDNLLSSFKYAVCQKYSQFTEEQLRKCFQFINKNLLMDKFTERELKKFCKLTVSEKTKLRKEQEESKDKKTKKNTLNEEIAKEMVSRYKIVKINNNNKNLFYKNENSNYEPLVLTGDYSLFEPLIDTLTGESLNNNDYNTIYKNILRFLPNRTDEDFFKYILVQNGAIAIENLNFIETNEIITRNTINAEYNPEAYDSNGDDFLNSICNDDESKRAVLEELMGQCILPINELNKINVIVGNTHNGKTTFLNAITQMIGKDNIAHASLKDLLTNRFMPYKLYGKTANFRDEISGFERLDIDFLKALTGESPFEADRKNKASFDFINGATLIFTCNKLPQFKEIDQALESRLNFITFENQFKNNADFIKRLTTDNCRSYFLKLAIEGIKRVRNNDFNFTYCYSNEKTTNNYLRDSDILKRFLAKRYEEKREVYREKLTELYNDFGCFWIENFGVKSDCWSHRVFVIKLQEELNCDKKVINKNGFSINAVVKNAHSRELRFYKKFTEESEVEKLQKELDEIDEEKPKTEIKEEKTEDKNLTEEVKKNTRDLIIFDFEVFKEDWIFGYKKISRLKSDQSYYSICNDRAKLVKFYNENKEALWVGYNSNSYDANILKAIVKGINPKEVSDYIIFNKDKSKLSFYKKFDFKGVCQDLITFDCCQKNGATIIGLKELEAYMGDSIEESSVDFNTDRKLTDAELAEVIKYNKHDVEETLKVFKNNIEDYQARRDLIKKYKLDSKCINKTKCQLSTLILGCQRPEQPRSDAEEIEFIPTLKIEKNKDVLDFYHDGNWRPIKTADKETNPQFVKLINGVPHCFGIGGLHGAIGVINDGIDEATPVHKKGHLLHIDVQSYYPSLMIKYNWLSRSCQKPELYKQIYEERLKLKAEGKKAEQAPLKIVLNATYGIMKDKWSDAYDPRQANNICINGQLALLDLIEKLEGYCDLIQTNTDGIIVQLKTMKDLPMIREIVKEWEDRIGVTTSFDYLTEIWQRDVNCYLIKYETEKGKEPKVECKGKELTFNDTSNNNINVVKEAVRQFMLNGTAVEKTINDPKFKLIDFQMLTKHGATYDYVCYGNKKLKTKYNRVFASADENDPCLYKVKNKKVEEAKKLDNQFDEMKDDKPLGAEKIANCPLNCFIVNGDINNKELPKKLDKKWYIKEAKRLLHQMTGGQHGEAEEPVKQSRKSAKKQ